MHRKEIMTGKKLKIFIFNAHVKDLPNTTCFPSRKSHFAQVMKNCNFEIRYEMNHSLVTQGLVKRNSKGFNELMDIICIIYSKYSLAVADF